ncbi:MAG TPA: glycoside hydrolase family 9 protein, partial [Polyangiaceae bacterium]
MAKSAPYTKFVDGADHTAAASVPTGDASYQNAANLLASNAQVPQGQTAPELTNFTNSLYPYVTQGAVDVAGGHHDAGDYSKYLMDSGFLIHTLTLAADDFAGVAALDNLGIPESGDGKSDVLQEAKWEADFAAKMQDADGLFYYLVYPKSRAYENDELPSKGDPQIVWPKNTYASAAATAALAEIASSPTFKQQFPADAARYLQSAKNGWNALQKAVSAHGKDGAYQFVYQDDAYLHDDMMAWAASALFVATGDAQYQTALEAWLPDPTDASTFQWSWWRMWRGWGNAIRTYAFAARSGRLQPSALDASYLAKCESMIQAAGDDQAKWAKASAYGTSLPVPTKNYGQAGWYFSGTQAFDLAVANAIAPSPAYDEAILENMAYEGGANPVNVAYLTGVGWSRTRELVSQFFENDRHRLPPTGIDYGNADTGYMYLDMYKSELEELTYPSDGAQTNPYAFYDRYTHQFNTSTEADTVNEGWGFAAIVALAAQSNAGKTPWQARAGTITAAPGKTVTAKLASDVDLGAARVTWEAAGVEPFVGGTSFTFTPTQTGTIWIDAEAMLPDGRR